jgi:MHS family proline/betaine transporter-like MFS transporter
VLARVIQGFAAGGEWGAAAAFMAEWSSPGRRGFYGGLLLASISAGLLMGSGVAALLTTVLSQDDMVAWGWRLPFLFGLVLIPVGLYLRRNVEEPPVFLRKRSIVLPPIKGEFIRLLARATGMALPLSIASYMATVYMPSFSQLHGHIERSQSLWGNTAALALALVGAPFFGHLSDRWGRTRLMMLACILMAVFAYPLFALIATGLSFSLYLACHLALMVVVLTYTGPGSASLTELFPTSSRATGAALANAFAGVLGGSSPFLSTWLISRTGVAASPALLIVAAAVIAFFALIGTRKNAERELR